MKTLAEKIAVMQAAERGEKIECRLFGTGKSEWVDAVPEPRFDWWNSDYRVAVKPREFWLVPYGGEHLTMPSQQRAEEFIANSFILGSYPQIIHVREVL